jgi:hypothetical protein
MIKRSLPNHFQSRDIDAAAQIRLFRKLKLTKCARTERRAGLFCVRAEKHLSSCHAAIAGVVGRNRFIAPLGAAACA